MRRLVAYGSYAVPGPKSDRKSTRLNSSHSQISYAVFCLKKKKTEHLLARAAHARTRPPAAGAATATAGRHTTQTRVTHRIQTRLADEARATLRAPSHLHS